MATPPKFPLGDKLAQAARGMAQGVGRRERRAPGLPIRQPSRRLRYLVVMVLAVVAGLLAWNWSDMRGRTLIGASYAARIGCVCRYVSNRGLNACEADLALAPLPGLAGMVSLSEDAETRSVSAGLPLLGHQSARFTPEWGCQLEAWDE